jgi:sugar/nucleoside kinase (ribokinase family)
VPPLALVGNLSFDLIDGGPPQVGGAPFHCARAWRALHVPATTLARCAQEDERRFRRGFARLGVPVRFVPAHETTTFSFTYEDDRRIMQVERAGGIWSPDDVAALPASAWVHVAPLLRGDFPARTLATVARGRRVSFDGQGLTRVRATGPLRLEPEPSLEPLLRHVSILKLAEEEAVALVGGIETGALAALGPPEILVTFGSRGSLVVAGGNATEVKARHIDADPTGSGDIFSAAYLASRASGHAPVSAARRATGIVSALLSGRAS